MGILFKHQEALEEAANGSRRSPTAKPPPLPAEAKVETKPEPKPELRFELRNEPKMEARKLQTVPIASPPPVPPAHHFSVEDFLKLLNDLPVRDNAALVVRVVEATLASVNVHVTDILPEITRRESVLSDRIEATQKRIEDLDAELIERRAELSELESELSETGHLRHLLNLTKTAAHSNNRDSSSDETLVLANAQGKSALTN